MKLLNHREAALLARVSQHTLARLVAEGRGPAMTRIGRKKLYAENDFNDWLQSLRTAALNPPGGAATAGGAS
jgi:hypothetical protein